MPRKPKRTKAQTRPAQLAALPRRPDLVIEGGLRPLGMYFRESKQSVQAHLALWVEAQRGLIRASEVINPSELGDDGTVIALQTLEQALTGPFPGLPSLLPGGAGPGPESILPFAPRGQASQPDTKVGRAQEAERAGRGEGCGSRPTRQTAS